jgi:hypothetical protein
MVDDRPVAAGCSHRLIRSAHGGPGESVGEIIARARRVAGAGAELSEQTLEALLRHELDGVRRVGVAYALMRVDEHREPLEALLDAFVTG